MIIAGLINLSPLWERLIDCIGMYYFLIHHQKATVASVKILSKSTCLYLLLYRLYQLPFYLVPGLALGWSITESAFTRFINFYMNARSLQFNWQHLITAGEANLALVSLL